MTEIFMLNEKTKEVESELKELMSRKSTDLYTGCLWLYEFLYNSPKILFSEMEERTTLGYFDSNQNCIVLRTELLADNLKEEREAIFLHEFAHWVVYRQFGARHLDHGKEFKEACKILKVPEDFSYAYAKIEVLKENQERMERKVRKLLALSESPFESESESAMNKARSLMNQYSLEYLMKEDNTIFGVEGKLYKRIDSWRNALYKIVGNLSGCYRIYQKKGKGSCISYFGSREQVESAIYFQSYLETALEEAYKKARKNLHGITQKNSFMLGLCTSLYKKTFETGLSKAVVQSQKKTEEIYMGYISGKIYHTSYGNNRGYGYSLGSQAGNEINVPTKQAALKVKRIGYNN